MLHAQHKHFIILSYLLDMIPQKTATWNGQIWSPVEDVSVTKFIFLILISNSFMSFKCLDS